jgi:choline-sulfatase
VQGGRVVSTLVQSYDFALTALDYAGLAPSIEDVDGRSLRPLLTGQPAADDLDRSVFSAIGIGWPMIRRGNHKYFVHSQHRTPVLFDLENDPGERVNLAGDSGYAEVEGDLSERLAQREAEPSLAQVDALMAP